MRLKTKTPEQLLAEQILWMQKCGGNLAGYVAHYGSESDPEHYGNGGEAIYNADYAEYERLLNRAQAYGRKRRNQGRRY